MKRLLATALALAAISATGSAQVTFGLGAQTGVSFSSFQKAISDFYGSGFGGGVHGDVSILKFLTARLNLEYFSFGSDKDKFVNLYVQANPGTQASDFSFDGANVSFFSVYANGLGRVPTGSLLTPYGLVGFGLNFISTSEGKVTYQNTPQPQASFPSSSETKFGINFGAGTEFSIGKASLFFETRYVLVFTKVENSSHIPLIVGVTVLI